MYVKCSVFCATHTNDVFLLKTRKNFKTPFSSRACIIDTSLFWSFLLTLYTTATTTGCCQLCDRLVTFATSLRNLQRPLAGSHAAYPPRVAGRFDRLAELHWLPGRKEMPSSCAVDRVGRADDGETT